MRLSETGKDAHAFFNSPPLICVLFRLISQVTEKLLEVENETMMKVADLEKVLLQKDKDLHAIRVSFESTPRHVFLFPVSNARS